MYINMNGGMKVNKVAFCMEDGRVGLLLCAAGMDGMRSRWQSLTSERAASILWRSETWRHQEARHLHCSTVGYVYTEYFWAPPKKNNQKNPNPKFNVKLHYSRKVVLLPWPVCSSTSWVEHNRNQLLVMWPFRQWSSLMSECKQRDAEVQIVFEPGHVVVESRIRYCLCLWFLRFIMLCSWTCELHS